jgi:hypothetical protein
MPYGSQSDRVCYHSQPGSIWWTVCIYGLRWGFDRLWSDKKSDHGLLTEDFAQNIYAIDVAGDCGGCDFSPGISNGQRNPSESTAA